MIEREIDYYYLEETDSLDELDRVILHDENGEHEDIEYVRKDKASGDTSDGYHTFDELYEHRTALLVALCNLTSARTSLTAADSPVLRSRYVFKSRQHHDGGMYDGMFIVGINCATLGKPYEWATWHCENKWWDLFFVPELDRAPKWDGHTPKDALERLLRYFTPQKEEQ